ncbi:MAG: hypothetical protein Q7K41_01555 [Dehalococcoidales bacterium]|nr:hypothetical protein [Dehalococcoidales bacterium]
MKKKKRTLYQCFNAKVDMKRIRCGKGYPLSPERVYLDHVQLENGEPLAPKICQQCDHFDSMGPPVPLEERGWHGLKRAGLVANHG